MTSAQIDDLPHLKLRQCRPGFMLLNPLDTHIGRSLEQYGEFSHEETLIFDQLLRPGDVAVDVGANIGAHTVGMARRVGPAGRIVAFEPQRRIFQTLCANIALNDLSNVDAYWAAAGRDRGSITVPRLTASEAHNFGALTLVGAATGDSVQMIKIDDLDLEACRFIKVDVEGMEGDVLAGAQDTIKRTRPILCVENDRGTSSRDLIEAILGLGYRAWWHLPAYFNPSNYNAKPDNIFQYMVSVNMLCIHESAAETVTGLSEVLGPDDTWERVARAADQAGVPPWLRPYPQWIHP